MAAPFGEARCGNKVSERMYLRFQFNKLSRSKPVEQDLEFTATYCPLYVDDIITVLPCGTKFLRF